ncbi:MAG: hypothetical protein M3362_11710 [Acidobacteriota bacterium]|nr:hypothetical protein [Acidobacteriota bacterium]
MNLKLEVMRRFGMWLLFVIFLSCLSLLFLHVGGAQREIFRPVVILLLQVIALCAFAVLNLFYFFFRFKERNPRMAKLPLMCFIGASIIYLQILPRFFGHPLESGDVLLFFFISLLSLTLINMIVIFFIKDYKQSHK